MHSGASTSSVLADFVVLVLGVLLAGLLGLGGLTIYATTRDVMLVQIAFGIAVIPGCAAVSTWFVKQLRPQMSKTHLFAYFATSMVILVVMLAIRNADRTVIEP